MRRRAEHNCFIADNYMASKEQITAKEHRFIRMLPYDYSWGTVYLYVYIFPN